VGLLEATDQHVALSVLQTVEDLEALVLVEEGEEMEIVVLLLQAVLQAQEALVPQALQTHLQITILLEAAMEPSMYLLLIPLPLTLPNSTIPRTLLLARPTLLSGVQTKWANMAY